MMTFSIKKYTIHKPFLFFMLLFLGSRGHAQVFPATHYPHCFIYPVRARISLAANFGELRPNHYHMGLDCRTDQVINRPVVAAAGGYIARVSITPFGFGQAVYINHPNGLTTVYGHLHRFIPELEKYVKEQQYKQESWNVDLEIPRGLFPVKQGQLIAYSGSTGGSMGPHCHFEIRDTRTGKVLNELLFGLPLPDKVAPTIVRLAMYDRNKSTYSQSPRIFSVRRIHGTYTTTDPLIVVHSTKISFGISAYDTQSGSANPNGIYEAAIFLDDLPLSAFRIDSISYDETRYVNAHVDYKTHAAGGPYIEHLSRLPGYPLGVYRDIHGDGVIELKDTGIHRVKIVVKDPAGNTSLLQYAIKKGWVDADPPSPGIRPVEFQPGVVNVFENGSLQLYLPPATLYDSLVFTYTQKAAAGPHVYSDVYSVLSGLVPAQDDFTVRIKTNRPVEESLKDNMIMKRTWKGKTEVVKATGNGPWYSAKFNAFGDFQLVGDDQPPVIAVNFHDNASLSRYKSIIITPKDNEESIKDFRSELDGRWLRFSNDKGRKYVYVFDEKCAPGKHELKVSVRDEAGNTTVRIFHFTR